MLYRDLSFTLTKCHHKWIKQFFLMRIQFVAVILHQAHNRQESGSAKANGREPKTGLGRVFNSMLGCIAAPVSKCMVCMQPLLKL